MWRLVLPLRCPPAAPWHPEPLQRWWDCSSSVGHSFWTCTGRPQPVLQALKALPRAGGNACLTRSAAAGWPGATAALPVGNRRQAFLAQCWRTARSRSTWAPAPCALLPTIHRPQAVRLPCCLAARVGWLRRPARASNASVVVTRTCCERRRSCRTAAAFDGCIYAARAPPRAPTCKLRVKALAACAAQLLSGLVEAASAQCHCVARCQAPRQAPSALAGQAALRARVTHQARPAPHHCGRPPAHGQLSFVRISVCSGQCTQAVLGAAARRPAPLLIATNRLTRARQAAAALLPGHAFCSHLSQLNSSKLPALRGTRAAPASCTEPLRPSTMLRIH